MIVIGERLNATRPAVARWIAGRDRDGLVGEARRQREAGADYLDVNAGTGCAGEPEALAWMVRSIQEEMDVPLCLDSPDPRAMEAALRAHRGKALVNSVSLERARFDPVVDLVLEHGAAVVALCLDDDGLPRDASETVAKGRRLVGRLLEAGVPAEDVYVDPLVRPIGTDPSAGTAVVEAVRRIRDEFPGVHVLCGLSNISFGLPRRTLLNQALLVAAMAAGLDAVILDPLDRELMALLAAAEAVLGRDRRGLGYVRAYRQGLLGGSTGTGRTHRAT